jgi:hypothetical protein
MLQFFVFDVYSPYYQLIDGKQSVATRCGCAVDLIHSKELDQKEKARSTKAGSIRSSGCWLEGMET